MTQKVLMNNDTLAVVIPVYNEDLCIKKVIEDWGSTLEALPINFKLIIVNDGSTDKTGEILDSLTQEHPELVVIHQENQGHGIAVKNGYIEATSQNFDYVFQTDSDDQFSSQDFPLFWEKRKEAPAIFGHRFKRHDPIHRKIISFFLRKMIFDFYEVNIPDANIPYRLFQGAFLKRALACLTPGLFAPNIFLSILCFKCLKSCPVIPVQHFERQDNSPKLIRLDLIKACIDSFWDLVVFSYQLKKKVQYIHEGTYQDNVVTLDQKRDMNIAA
jgi:dolichol-phosphate mannosyltransferase